MAARLLEQTFTLATNMEVLRSGVRYTGDEALGLAKQEEVRDLNGAVVMAADLSGVGHRIQKLTNYFEIHGQYKHT